MIMNRQLSYFFASSMIIAKCAALNIPLENVYVGISIGPSFHEAKPKNANAVFFDPFMAKSPYLSIFAGYDHLIEETPLFVGLEGEIANHVSKKTKYGPNSTLKLSTSNSLSANVRMGVVVNDAKIYGTIGMAHTNWKTNLSGPCIQDAHKSYQLNGKQFGVGMECSINKNCAIGVEHTFTSFNSISRIFPHDSLKLSPVMNVTKLRLSYTF